MLTRLPKYSSWHHSDVSFSTKYSSPLSKSYSSSWRFSFVVRYLFNGEKFCGDAWTMGFSLSRSSSRWGYSYSFRAISLTQLGVILVIIYISRRTVHLSHSVDLSKNNSHLRVERREAVTYKTCGLYPHTFVLDRWIRHGNYSISVYVRARRDTSAIAFPIIPRNKVTRLDKNLNLKLPRNRACR